MLKPDFTASSAINLCVCRDWTEQSAEHDSTVSLKQSFFIGYAGLFENCVLFVLHDSCWCGQFLTLVVVYTLVNCFELDLEIEINNTAVDFFLACRCSLHRNGKGIIIHCITCASWALVRKAARHKHTHTNIHSVFNTQRSDFL